MSDCSTPRHSSPIVRASKAWKCRAARALQVRQGAQRRRTATEAAAAAYASAEAAAAAAKAAPPGRSTEPIADIVGASSLSCHSEPRTSHALSAMASTQGSEAGHALELHLDTAGQAQGTHDAGAPRIQAAMDVGVVQCEEGKSSGPRASSMEPPTLRRAVAAARRIDTLLALQHCRDKQAPQAPEALMLQGKLATMPLHAHSWTACAHARQDR
jgi:hypothetical protein